MSYKATKTGSVLLGFVNVFEPFSKATLVLLHRYLAFSFMFCLLVVVLRLSAPVQVIDWKESSRKLLIMC